MFQRLFLPVTVAACFVVACRSEMSPSAAAAGTAVERLKQQVRFAGESSSAPRSGHADIALPLTADAAFRVTDSVSGLSISVASEHAESVPGETADGFTVFRRAQRGGDVLLHAMPEGVEDFVWVEEAPMAPRVSYRVTLGDKVAGLRLVANTLELVDVDGTPRLRAGAPYLVDGTHRRHDAVLSVQGCAVDTSPLAPWGRAPVDPGSRQCTVVVSWSGSRVAYPAVLDPAWTTTTQMVVSRSAHGAARLKDGHILVIGGSTYFDDYTFNDSCQLFDFTTQTWAMTGSLKTARGHFTTALLPNGSVLVAGGEVAATSGGSSVATKTAEAYDPSTGQWSNTGNTLKYARTRHAGVVLSDGRVLVAGGQSDPNSSSSITNTVEIYDPTANSWALAHSMNTARTEIHDQAVLLGSSVLVAGGAGTSGDLSTSELYDPASDMWTPVGDLKTKRSRAAAVVLKNGQVLIAGGSTYTSELFDPVAMAWTKTTGNLNAYRNDFTLNLFSGGVAIAIGGDVDLPDDTAETFDPSTGSWTTMSDSLQHSHAQHTTTVVGDGRLLVTGGGNKYAEVYDQPQTCNSNEDCLSGFCVDSYCCNTACDGGCDRCDMPGSLGICSPAPAHSPGSGPVCAPYLCDGTHPNCPTMCQSDADCSSGNTCHSGVCGSMLANGKPCGDQSQCASGFCVDGVCCDSACNGSCQACNSDAHAGTCVSVAGQPVAGHMPCQTGGLCGGTCDGISPQCTYPVAGSLCGTPSCAAGISTPAAQCDGAGSCVEGRKTTCEGECDGDACAVSTAKHTAKTGCGCGSDGAVDGTLLVGLALWALMVRRRHAS